MRNSIIIYIWPIPYVSCMSVVWKIYPKLFALCMPPEELRGSRTVEGAPIFVATQAIQL